MSKQDQPESNSFKAYRSYLEAENPQGGGKVTSYLTVIKKLGKILNRHEDFPFVPDDFSEIKNLDLLYRIYEFVIGEQKKPDGGIFNDSELTKSYWEGRHAFCSAAVKSFVEFRVKTYDGPVSDTLPNLLRNEINSDSVQLITYGAPGTGKSHKIDACTNEGNSIRVTFHPDTDYAAFVGAYKPTMDEQERYALDATGTTHKIEAKEKTIVYSFVPQAFMKAYVEAWRRYADAGLQGDAKTYYLVIEEINRGNCAQIFGDLFQLLDRADNGFSAYAITPDDDIQKFLATDKDYKLADIPLTVDVKKMTEDGEKVIATADDIKTGKKLVLPPNLCIWATMNTSDQSLFPIDSAFKRRWEWEYMPIEDAGKGWKIDVGGVQYKWWSFLEKINEVIATETSSEDKQLGYFFVKAKDDMIDAKTFVSKVVFYLWGDVFKDNLPDEDAFKYTFKKDGKDNKRPIRFADFYHPESGNTKEQWRDKLLTSFLDALEVEKESPAANASGTPDASGQGSANAAGGVAEAGE